MTDTIAPQATGIGLRTPHYAALLEARPALGFLEVHSENYFSPGGPALAWLERFAASWALSFHGVGMALGSADPLDERHLAKLDALVRRFEPALVSEHLCWGMAGGRHANDLLPLAYSEEALALVAARIDAVQERLGRRILVENVSSYLAMEGAAMSEWEFVAEVSRRSGCGVLLDVNNVWVSSRNHGFDPVRFIDGLDPESVGEIHLAGHEREGELLIDTHSRRVCDEVWSLYEYAIARLGARPTLVEWDADIPALGVLLDEAREAARRAAHALQAQVTA
ncbi:MAG TPA: DUF692 domain-containing protein [Usitatibacter sp.]|jgi:hypothetical protein|nr:DUF692 domain-containing protein [Usitatibacter sp.]